MNNIQTPSFDAIQDQIDLLMQPEFRAKIRANPKVALRDALASSDGDDAFDYDQLEFEVVTSKKDVMYFPINLVSANLSDVDLSSIQAAGSASSASTVGTAGSASSIFTIGCIGATIGCVSCIASLGTAGSVGSAASH